MMNGPPFILTVMHEPSWNVLLHLRKRRYVFQYGNVRIHIDDVEDLGWFLEVEAGLPLGEPHETAIRQVCEVMDRLGILVDDVIPGSYLDIWGRERKVCTGLSGRRDGRQSRFIIPDFGYQIPGSLRLLSARQ
jgi:hypothetical protein